MQRFMSAIREVALATMDDGRSTIQAAKPPTTAESTGSNTSTVHRPSSIVIFMDEIDVVRSLPFSTDELFAAIRECYNRRTEDPELERLTFCLMGVAAPTDLIRDTRLTPFNIGRRIELTDFTADEAAPLEQGLDVGTAVGADIPPKERPSLLDCTLSLTRGQPCPVHPPRPRLGARRVTSPMS